jgi:hypothetical protein
VELAPGLGQEPGKITEALDVTQTYDLPVEGEGPVLTLAPEDGDA